MANKCIPLERRYGDITVLSEERVKGKVLCRCICGKEWFVAAQNLRNGTAKSCGCIYRINDDISPDPKRGIMSHPLYKTWSFMRERCNIPTTKAYPRYGGRGIYVCDEWNIVDRGASGFRAFLRDMEPKPEGYSLDRIDNDGPYSKENCRWTDHRTQCNNKECSLRYEFQGESIPLSFIAEKLGVSYTLLWRRIEMQGWTPERAFSTPSARPQKRKKSGPPAV